MRGVIDEPTRGALEDALSFLQRDAERTRAYLNGTWDGRVRLFRHNYDGSFTIPAGLVPIAAKVIVGMGGDVEITGFGSTRSPLGLTMKTGVVLRDYQQTALASAIASPTGGGVIALPTGAGKTEVGLRFAVWYDQPFTIIVHRKELLYQWDDTIRESLGIEPGLIGDGKVTTSDSATIAMVQTVAKNMRLLPDTPTLIMDEAHVMPARLAYQVGTGTNAMYRLGLTATPMREDGADMKIWAVAGPVVQTVTVEDLVSRGYLARPRFKLVRLSPVSSGRNDEFADVYRDGIVMNAERNNRIVGIATDLASQGRQVYIHVIQVDHGTYLANAITAAGIDATFLSGETPSKRRKVIVEAFKRGEIPVLVSTLLKEGVNIPRIDALIFAAGYQSRVLTIQTIGRALRAREGKIDAVVVDFIDIGHYMLSRHANARIETYRAVYGAYCDYEIV